VENVAIAVLPEMRRSGCTWGQAAQKFLALPVNQRYAARRPQGYSDDQWLAALYQARLLERKGPPQHHRVTP
jgi:hypothetical protein